MNKKILAVLLFSGFLLRIYLTRFGDWGDVSVFAEWGRRFWDLDLINFYFDKNWYYSFPTYPPLASYVFGGLYWLYDHRYILAQIHNIIKIIPANFIIYFSTPVPKDPFLYGYGYYLLLKIPSILSDLGIAIIIYKLLFKLTKNQKTSFLGFCFYLFNPISIFLSGVWGQNDSLVAFLGLLSFFLLFEKRTELSIPVYFISIFIKPVWIIFCPIYLFLLIYLKLNKKKIFIGFALSLLIFLITTIPFSGKDIIQFSQKVLLGNILPSAKGVPKASISAFNMYSLFYRIDYTPANLNFLFLPLNKLGILIYVFFNIIGIRAISVKDNISSIFKVLSSIFLIGTGVFLFQTGMLERYFFPVFPIIIIMMLYHKKYFWVGLIINFIYFLNIIWSFYRRSNGIIDHLFSDNNFLLIHFLSLCFLVLNIYLVYSLDFLNSAIKLFKRAKN